MKRKAAVLITLTLIFLILYVNRLFELEYDVNIPEYFQYSSDYTKEEREILKKYEPLIYGGNINEPPLGIYYSKYNQYTGIVVDYMNALSIELGTAIMSRPMVWNQALEELKSGRTNLCDMIPSEERSKFYAFSNPLYKLSGIVAVKDINTGIQQLADLRGKRIAVQKGDIIIGSVEKIGSVNIVETDNAEEALKLLRSDKVDAVCGDEPVIRYYLNELSDAHDYRILEKPLYESSCVIAVPKNQSELVPILNKAIFGMRHKGILDSIEKKWAGPYTGYLSENYDLQKQQMMIVLILFICLVVGYIIYLWNRSLKVLVDSRTKELSFMKNELEITFDGIEDFLAVIGNDLKIKNINRSFLDYLKLKKEDVVDKPFDQLPILSDFEKKQNNLLRRMLSSGPEYGAGNSHAKYELKSRRKLFEVAAYALTVETADQPDLLVMISDVTVALLEKQKLIQSNKMETIGQLAAGVAHELKNPLGIIRNSGYILRDECDRKNELTAMSLDAIDHSVSRAGNIIDNLLKYARLTPDDKRPVNIRNAIQEALALSRKQITEQSVRLNIDCSESICVCTNHESLEHILLNLVNNALDAMPRNGALTISCTEQEHCVEIKVRDTGSGIEEEELDHIFEPFYTTKPVGKGTGLGLYIVYSEVENIRGEIRVESEIENGTTFIITIPKEGEVWQAD